MMLVEADVDGEWDSRIDWPGLAARAALAALAYSRYAALSDSRMSAEVSVKFTSDAEVRALNAAWRRKDQPTNVLSFPMIEGDLAPVLGSDRGGDILVGDIVLAAGICAAEAAERDIRLEDHASHLVVHGMLHLLGYDHETGAEDAEHMEEVERTALASLGIADPYRADLGLQDHHHG